MEQVACGGAPMSGKPVDIEHWSCIASEWTAWARAANHDAFWAYRASLISFIGHGTGDSLDVGCGEGRVSRGEHHLMARLIENVVSCSQSVMSRSDPRRSRAAFGALLCGEPGSLSASAGVLAAGISRDTLALSATASPPRSRSRERAPSAALAWSNRSRRPPRPLGRGRARSPRRCRSCHP